MRIETLAVHAGRGIDPATGAVATPIHLSTTFAREPDGGVPHGYVYSRFANPNRDSLEKCLVALEGGAAAAAFASGSAATAAILQALAPGHHVTAPVDAYHGTTKILRDVLGPWGLETTFVDMTDPGAVERAIRPGTKLVWIETPSNPLLRVTDIAAICGIARRAGLIAVCDNTWATPALQRPFDLGADLILHATTKYLSGQHDVLGGAVVAKREDEFFQRIRNLQIAGGAVPSPFECWLVLRGISTLFCRMPGPEKSPRKRYRGAPDGPAWRNALVPGTRREGAGHRGGWQAQAIHPCDEPGWPTEPDRASLLHRASGLPNPGKSPPGLSGPRASRRPDRRSRPGARLAFLESPAGLEYPVSGRRGPGGRPVRLWRTGRKVRTPQGRVVGNTDRG